MTGQHTHPCATCPWVHGASADRIPGYDPVRARVDLAACADSDRGLMTPLMACHKSSEGDDLVCVGYAVSNDGYDNIALRLMAVTGRVDLAAMYDAVEKSGAKLWPTYVDMIEALTRSETVPLTVDQVEALEAAGVDLD